MKSKTKKKDEKKAYVALSKINLNSIVGGRKRTDPEPMPWVRDPQDPQPW